MSKPPTVLDIGVVQPSNDAESAQRLPELASLAQQTFESPEEAADWMRRPNPMLGGTTPRECAKSNSGGERVKAILVAIKHGGVA